MAGMTLHDQSRTAAGGAAPAGRWSATAFATSFAATGHHVDVIPAVPANSYEVKPSIKGITRRPTEGSS